MKTKIIITFFLMSMFFCSNAQQSDTLSNNTIIQLTKIGLPAQTIISKIKTSICLFDVSVKGLLELQSSGVSGDVITEMIKNNEEVMADINKKVNKHNPNSMQSPGIYLYNINDTINPLKRFYPTVTSTNKSGGFETAIAQQLTYGIAKNRVKSTLAGAKSRFQIEKETPTFYFYFENNDNPNADNWFFATATSPNEFVLITLVTNRSSREMVIGESNAYGSSSGIPDDIKVAFNVTEISEGIFKVTPEKPLKKGEYCFLYASSTPTRFSNNKVFDFGISIENNR